MSNKLETIMTTNDKLSFRKLAAFTDISHALILKRAKEPIVGQVYNPEAINWTAIEKLLADRKVDIDKIDWAKVEGTTVETPVKELKLEVNDKFTLRYKPYQGMVFTLLIKTATHACFMAADSTEPKCMAHNTLIACGITKLTAEQPVKTEDEKQADESMDELAASLNGLGTEANLGNAVEA